MDGDLLHVLIYTNFGYLAIPLHLITRAFLVPRAMVTTLVVLYLLSYSALAEVCNLLAGPSPIYFDNPESWDCKHVPTSSSDVKVALNQGSL